MRTLYVIPLCLTVAAAADQAWEHKKIAEWSEDDAKMLLTDSPWARPATPKVSGSSGGGQRRGGWGGMGGPRIGIPGMGGPRMGGGRRGGMGYPGGGQPRGGDEGGRTAGDRQPADVVVRWESAMPVRAAELKAREVDAPDLDETHYAVAVVGVPLRLVNRESVKPKAELKCDGKKKIKTSGFRILHKDDNHATVVFLFPKSKEIGEKVAELDFDAHIGRMEVQQDFRTSAMKYEGKLEL